MNTCRMGTEHASEYEANQCNFGSFIEGCEAMLRRVIDSHPDERTREMAQEALDSRTGSRKTATFTQYHEFGIITEQQPEGGWAAFLQTYAPHGGASWEHEIEDTFVTEQGAIESAKALVDARLLEEDEYWAKEKALLDEAGYLDEGDDTGLLKFNPDKAEQPGTPGWYMSRKTAAELEWCDCGHWVGESIPAQGQHGRCSFCYQNCPAVGGCQRQKWAAKTAEWESRPDLCWFDPACGCHAYSHAPHSRPCVRCAGQPCAPQTVQSSRKTAEFPPKEDEAPAEDESEDKPKDTGNRPEPWPEAACGEAQDDTFCVLDVGHPDDHIFRSRQWIEAILPPPASVAPAPEQQVDENGQPIEQQPAVDENGQPVEAPEDEEDEDEDESKVPPQFKKKTYLYGPMEDDSHLYETGEIDREAYQQGFTDGQRGLEMTSDEDNYVEGYWDGQAAKFGMRIGEAWAIVIDPDIGEIAVTEDGFPSREEAERYLRGWDFGPKAYVTTLDEAMALNLGKQSVRTAMLKGAPFAGYDDFADCVSKNSDKDDPEAYCGSIKHKVEDSKTGILVIAEANLCKRAGCPNEGTHWTGYCPEHVPRDPRILQDISRSQSRVKEIEMEGRKVAQNPYQPENNPFLNQDLAPNGTPDEMLDGPPASPAVTTTPMTTRPRQMPGGSTEDQASNVAETGGEAEPPSDDDSVVFGHLLPMICLSTRQRFTARLEPEMRCVVCGRDDFDLDERTAMMEDVPVPMLPHYVENTDELPENGVYAEPFKDEDQFQAEIEQTLARKFRVMTQDAVRAGSSPQEARKIALKALRLQGVSR